MSVSSLRASDSLNPRGPWRVLGVALAAAALILGSLFWREILGAWRVWMSSPTYNHCFLVLPVALYLIWDRRRLLVGIAPEADFRALILLPFLSLAWLAAAVLGILEFQQLILLTMVQAMLLAALGWPLYKRLLGPLLYLYLLVPSGEFLVPTLQDVTARFAVDLLGFFHVPVFSDGIMISIPEGDFIVAEACAGLRFLIASIAFGAFFALNVYRSWWKRAAFMATALIVPVFANGIRAFGIIYLAHLTDDVTAVEADHIIYGWGFFTAVLMLLIVIGMRFADRGPDPALAHMPQHRRHAALGRKPLVALALALLLVASGPAYLAFLDQPVRPLELAEASPPPVAPPWQARADGVNSWQPVIIAPDREFRDSFVEPGAAEVERYVALYSAYGRHNNLVRSQNRIVDEDVWVRSTMGSARAEIDGRPVSVASTEIHSAGLARLVWSFYVVDGVATASPAEAKLRQARAILLGQPAVSAFVAISAAKGASGVPPEQALQGFLDAMGPLGPYLDNLRQASASEPASLHRVAARPAGIPHS
jgi:exosortase A